MNDEAGSHLTIREALGTSPSSFKEAPKSTASNTFFGKCWVKLPTSRPDSWLMTEATSNNVVSTEKDFWILPVESWSRSRVSVYADAGFEETGPDAVEGPVAGVVAGTERPSRSAFSFSAFRRRSSLSAAIFSLIRCLAAISSCFSFRFAAASLSCSFFLRSSLISWVSLVLFRRISYRDESFSCPSYQSIEDIPRSSFCPICPALTHQPAFLQASSASHRVWPSSPLQSKVRSPRLTRQNQHDLI